MGFKQEQGISNLKWGKQAEAIAHDYLIAQGFTIRERNWRVGNSIEIDIIAERGATIHFIEVKARKGDFISPEDAVNLKKQKKMIRGGDIYLRSLPYTFQYSLDIITITGTAEEYSIDHMIDAFLPSLT